MVYDILVHMFYWTLFLILLMHLQRPAWIIKLFYYYDNFMINRNFWLQLLDANFTFFYMYLLFPRYTERQLVRAVWMIQPLEIQYRKPKLWLLDVPVQG